MKKLSWLLSLLFFFLPAVAEGQAVKYYHLDALGSVRAVTNQNQQIVERHDYLPFGEEPNPPAATNTRKFTGKERDQETGFDYFEARYYTAKLGRFTSSDPAYTLEENLVDPQRWNRYAYARSNPHRYVDPDGRAIETPWDAFNVGLDVASLAANISSGNVVGAVVDAVGLVYDISATAVPGLPGGAGSAIRAARSADKAIDAAKGADALITISRAAGKAAEVKVAAEVAQEGGKILGSQVCCRTSLGRRVVDHLVEDGGGTIAAIEVKSGNATRSTVQRAKDAEIAAGRGTFVGKNAPAELRGQQRAIQTFERKPRN